MRLPGADRHRRIRRAAQRDDDRCLAIVGDVQRALAAVQRVGAGPASQGVEDLVVAAMAVWSGQTAARAEPPVPSP
jgi:hypothetical protein